MGFKAQYFKTSIIALFGLLLQYNGTVSHRLNQIIIIFPAFSYLIIFIFRFSRDGNSIAIGNERGKVFLNTWDDMPFPPHYQYDTLEKTIFTAVVNYPDLMNELKSLGYFGYPHKAFVMPP